MKSHEKIKELLTGFALGELTEQQERAITTHLAECELCSVELKRIEALLEYTEQMRDLSVEQQVCESAKESLLAAISNEENKRVSGRKISLAQLGRRIMESRITKYAAAAVIIIAAGIIIAQLNGVFGEGQVALDEGQVEVINGTEDVVAGDTTLAAELEQIKQMFTAGDADGLVKMLGDGQFESKVAAAKCLGKIGDQSALASLTQLSEQWSGAVEDNPFAAAIEEIESGAAGTSSETTEDTSVVGATAGVVAAGTETAKEAGDELLRLIPAKSLFCLRVNKFDYTLGTVDQYISGLSPIPLGVSMLARIQLGGVLGDPAL